MSIILKGIDLPRCSNEDCIVVIRKDKAEVWQTGFKERTVKAIQIPKNHGKIVDLDDLVVEYWDGNSMEIDNEAYDNAVAILEAEE